MDFKHKEIWWGKREGLGFPIIRSTTEHSCFPISLASEFVEQQKRLQILVFSWCYKLSHSKHLFLEATYMLRVYKVE